MSRVRSIRTIWIQRAEKDIKSNQIYVREHNWKLATCNKNAPNFWKIPFVRGRNCMMFVFFYIPSNHCLSSILFYSHPHVTNMVWFPPRFTNIVWFPPPRVTNIVWLPSPCQQYCLIPSPCRCLCITIEVIKFVILLRMYVDRWFTQSVPVSSANKTLAPGHSWTILLN